MKTNSPHDNRSEAGSSPAVRTIIPSINTNSLVSRTLSEQVSATGKYPLKISHYNLEGKIYKGADGYHAVWNTGGKRIKKQYKRLKDAKSGARETLKLIHKGQGKRPAYLPGNCLG